MFPEGLPAMRVPLESGIMHLRFAPVAIVAATVLAACTNSPEDSAGQESTAPTTAPTTSATPKHNFYVALGDSYAAMGSTDAPTDGPAPCVRSADNYPAGVLADARVTGTDVTCSGAQTEHLLGPWEIGGEVIAPQVEALTPETTLVTVSIGGNDINFGAIVDCFVADLSAGRPTTCGSRLGDTIDARLAGLPTELDAVHAAIAERSPDADVIATGYVPLVAASGPCADVPTISAEDRAWVVDLTDRLNAEVEAAADRAGADYVLPPQSEEHTGCAQPDQRWVDFFGTETGSYPMHPTAAGQQAMAAAVLGRLD